MCIVYWSSFSHITTGFWSENCLTKWLKSSDSLGWAWYFVWEYLLLFHAPWVFLCFTQVWMSMDLRPASSLQYFRLYRELDGILLLGQERGTHRPTALHQLSGTPLNLAGYGCYPSQEDMELWMEQALKILVQDMEMIDR